MEGNGGQWRAMEGNGGQWRAMEGNGGQWRAMEGNGGQLIVCFEECLCNLVPEEIREILSVDMLTGVLVNWGPR